MAPTSAGVDTRGTWRDPEGRAELTEEGNGELSLDDVYGEMLVVRLSAEACDVSEGEEEVVVVEGEVNAAEMVEANDVRGVGLVSAEEALLEGAVIVGETVTGSVDGNGVLLVMEKVDMLLLVEVSFVVESVERDVERDDSESVVPDGVS
ncbi:hypothetical protein TRAPUB_13237 [Trametes pubescens]|uniref:Uncharacterized protein n=1 Tax=Trametes pubescens TaxID=154538 RepID=A0A1M2VRK8_TRAPU|nr:hypothetical protein TRAPUB_13237 [Trametes pubescens]